MSVPRFARLVLLAFAAGCAPLTLALALPGQPAPASAPALKVAHLLNSIAQSRFQDTSMLTFGASRMMVSPSFPKGQHNTSDSFAPRNDEENQTLRTADALNRDYVIDFFHCAPIPPVPPPSHQSASAALVSPELPSEAPLYSTTRLFVHVRPLPSAPLMLTSLHSRLRSEAVTALPKLRAGKEVQTSGSDWTVLMRPVLAAQDSCLSCHTTAKKNDTLGVMVYAVRNTPVNTVSKP